MAFWLRLEAALWMLPETEWSFLFGQEKIKHCKQVLIE